MSTDTLAMTANDLESLASSVYGWGWQSQLSREMGIGYRTVQRWAGAGINKPATADAVRRFIDERRTARIPAPPAGTSPEDDRDDACADAIDAPIAATLAAAEAVGWSRAEALTAGLSIIVTYMRASAGTPATITTLRAAIETLKSERGA